MTEYIGPMAQHLADLLSKKNKDYAPTTEFSNFEEAASLAGIDSADVMLAQIAIKYSRLKTLVDARRSSPPNFESIQDTLLDLAGYSIITAAHMNYSAAMTVLESE